jgi:hypothetical protein
MAALILALVAVFFAVNGYAIKYRGRVDLIAGVKNRAALKNPEAVGNWVGNMSFAIAAILAVAALLAWPVPSQYLWPEAK